MINIINIESIKNHYEKVSTTSMNFLTVLVSYMGPSYKNFKKAAVLSSSSSISTSDTILMAVKGT